MGVAAGASGLLPSDGGRLRSLAPVLLASHRRPREDFLFLGAMEGCLFVRARGPAAIAAGTIHGPTLCCLSAADAGLSMQPWRSQ